MTDDKVKALLERMANECSVDMVLWDQFSNAVLALQAKRDNLSAEVERLTTLDHVNFHDTGSSLNLIRPSEPFYELAQNARRAMVSVAVYSSNAKARAEAAEAKLTALVEAVEKSRERFLDYERQHLAKGTEDADRKARVNHDMAAMCEQALAHHSAPVVEAMCPVCGGSGQRPGGEWNCETCEGTGRPLSAPPTTPTSAPVEDVAAIIKRCHDQRGDVPDDWIRSAAELITGQPCKASVLHAPVEDVGGLLRKHMEASGTCVWDREPDGEGTDWCGYLSYAERDAFLAALSPSLIQPADPTEGCPISSDGPHAITEHRRWLARQLLDSKLDDAEAFGIVRHFPAITDLIQPQGEERS